VVSCIVLLPVAALLITGCPPDNGMPVPSWQQVLSNLPAGLLSVSGTSGTDVYAVGADPGDGKGPLVYHYNGQQWTRLRTGATGDLWWISDRQIGSSFFMGGEGGLILSYTPVTNQFERFVTPGIPTIFGIWGLTESNVIAVGGDVNQPDTSGFVWRFDGANWSVEDLSHIDPAGIPVAFKVWGRSANDIYVCGARGTILHYDGMSWSQLPSGTMRTLFTVHGNDSSAAACGGAQSGVLVEQNGATFVDVTPANLLQMNGVFVPIAGEAVAVGREGSVAFRTGAGWEIRDTGLNLDLLLDYHTVWVDPLGGVWAVGGNIAGEPQTAGIVSHFGTQTIGSIVVD
jgi:hypothetical protein